MFNESPNIYWNIYGNLYTYKLWIKKIIIEKNHTEREFPELGSIAKP